MSATRLTLFFLMIHLIHASNDTYFVFPEVTIQALKPRGFRAYIPGDSRISLFYIEANFYDKSSYTGSINEFVVRETKGLWMYEDRVTRLKAGMVVSYSIFVALARGNLDYSKKFLAYGVVGRKTDFIIKKISVLEDPDVPIPIPSTSSCRQTDTRVLGSSRVCGGQTIFEDNFDMFREDLWQIDQYIPVDHPDHPFISYQNSPQNRIIEIKDGMLKIQPKPQQDLAGLKNVSLFSGKLNLYDECTGQICAVEGTGLGILPPVVSGRLTSKFVFTYGIVEIRAKMPIGDWILPELLLESYSKKYGSLNYASGVVKIASTSGNEHLNDPSYTNKFLRGMALTNAVCRPTLEMTKEKINGTWSDDFHVYSVKWTTSSIELFVDGEKWGRFRPGKRGLRSWMPLFCREKWFKLLDAGGMMAPFDHHFLLSLSLSVGGTEFPDTLITGNGKPKPWKNLHRRAASNFWKDRANWYPTWRQPLIVDYVKIKAL